MSKLFQGRPPLKTPSLFPPQGKPEYILQLARLSSR